MGAISSAGHSFTAAPRPMRPPATPGRDSRNRQAQATSAAGIRSKRYQMIGPCAAVNRIQNRVPAALPRRYSEAATAASSSRKKRTKTAVQVSQPPPSR